MKQILHITSSHPPYDGRIFQKELKSLSTHYDCHQIITNKYGNLNNNKKDKINHSNIDNIKTYSIPMYSRNIFLHKVIAFLRKYLLIGKIFFIDNVKESTINILEKEELNPSIIHYHDLELSSVINSLKKKYNCKIIFDSHEFFFTYPLQKSSNIFSMLKSYFVFNNYVKAIKNSDFVITVTDTMKHLVEFISNDINCSIIFNSSILPINNTVKQITQENKIVLVHEGNLLFNRGLSLMLDIFQDDYIRKNVTLKIVGDIKGNERKYFDKKLKEYSLTEDNILVTGWIKYENLHNYLDGHIGILFFEKTLNTYLGMPNKVYNYISQGQPILTTKCYESTKLIENYGVGKAVDRNVKSVVDGIKEIIANYEYYQKNVLANQSLFLWKNDEVKLLNIYEKLIK